MWPFMTEKFVYQKQPAMGTNLDEMISDVDAIG